MTLYVLTGCYGYDPPDVQVLGVFNSRLEAENRKVEIDRTHNEYWKSAALLGESTYTQWKVWFKSLKGPGVGCSEWHRKFQRFALFMSEKFFVELVSYEGRRKEFLDMAEGLATSENPLPELPPVIELPNSPMYSEYEMKIHEVEGE